MTVDRYGLGRGWVRLWKLARSGYLNKRDPHRPSTLQRPHTCSLEFRFVRSPFLLGCMRVATRLASGKAASPLAKSLGMYSHRLLQSELATTNCVLQEKGESP